MLHQRQAAAAQTVRWYFPPSCSDFKVESRKLTLVSSFCARRQLQAINGKTQAFARQSMLLREANTPVEAQHIASAMQVWNSESSTVFFRSAEEVETG